MGREYFRTAWDAVADDFIDIHAGEAEALRARCAAGEIVCATPGCSDKAITTRRTYRHWKYGTVVEDGFRHLALSDADTAHSPESQRHIDGKSAVAAWQRRLGGSVRVEHVLRRHDDGSKPKVRRPDVTATLGDLRMAFEIQVSDLSDVALIRRTTDLRNEFKRHVVWMFCWFGIHAGDEDLPQLTSGLRQLVEWGEDIWFLDPYADGGPMLGRAYSHAVLDERVFTVHPQAGCPVLVKWRPIDEWRLNPAGRVVGVDEHDAWSEEQTYKAARAAQEARMVALREQRLCEQAVAPPPPEWVRPGPVGDLGDAVEAICALQLRDDFLVYAPAELWHRQLAHRFLHDPHAGGVEELTQWLRTVHNCHYDVRRAVVGVVRLLERAAPDQRQAAVPTLF